MEDASSNSAVTPVGGDSALQQTPVIGGEGGVTRPSDSGGRHTVVRGTGHVLERVQVHLIFWGHAWKGKAAPLIEPVRAAVDSILTGPYLAGLAEYGVGPGVLHGLTVIGEPSDRDPQPGFDFSTAGPVGPFVRKLITTGRVPAENAGPSVLNCVVMPPGVLCKSGDEGQLLGEHAFIEFNGRQVLHAFITARDSAPNAAVDEYSWIFSHEIAEACTDPVGETYQVDNLNPNNWNEIGDVCQRTETRVNGVKVQLYWSQQHNACFAPLTMPTPRWTPMGGQVNGGMAVAANQNGSLQLFVRGMDDRVYRRFQTAPNGAWNAKFEPLNGKIGGQIVALRNLDGRLALFARDLNAVLAHSVQLAANQDNWSAWSPLDPAPNSVQVEDHFVGIANKDGRLALFARRNDGVVLHRSQQKPGGNWDAWAPLDQAVRVTGALAIARNGDGRLELFGCDAQGAVHHTWQETAGGAWTAWASLGGKVRNLLAVGRNQDGRLEVFMQGEDQVVQHRWQQHAGDSQHWNASWVSLGGKVNDVMSVAANKGGQLEVFGRGDKNALWHVRQHTPNGGWENWSSLGGDVSDLLAVGTNTDGRLEVFVRSSQKVVQHTWQRSPGGPWIT
jgi:hypothetical protein